MGKYAIFAFQRSPICFTHVMLNALDLNERGHEVKVILEGEAVVMIREMREKHSALFAKMEELGLIDCVCKGCSNEMGVLEYNMTSGIRVDGEMTGHPPMGAYIDAGYQIITL